MFSLSVIIKRAFETIEDFKVEKAEHGLVSMLLRTQAFVLKGKKDKTRFDNFWFLWGVNDVWIHGKDSKS